MTGVIEVRRCSLVSPPAGEPAVKGQGLDFDFKLRYNEKIKSVPDTDDHLAWKGQRTALGAVDAEGDSHEQ